MADFGENQENVSDQIFFTIQKNPLLIDPILRCMFDVLDYDTLKECRQVCTQWKKISDLVFIKRSAFDLSPTQKDVKTLKPVLKTPVDITSLFSSIDPHAVRFSAFRFELNILNTPLREMYVEPNLLTMLELKITASDHPPNFNPNIDSLIGPNLTKLTLKNEENSHIVTVSLQKLASIRQIYLNECKISLNSDFKMKPKELTIIRCAFKEFGSRSFTNWFDILDFDNLQKLHLVADWDQSPKPSLFWTDCLNIKCLNIQYSRICLLNISRLSAKICPEELSLAHNEYGTLPVPMLHETTNFMLNDCLSCVHLKKLMLKESNQVFHFTNLKIPIDEVEIQRRSIRVQDRMENNIKKMKVCDCDDIANVFDLSVLPETLESLDLPKGVFHFFQCSDPAVCFPNLKELILTECFEYLKLFQNCPSLTFVKLIASNFFARVPEEINLDHLPHNIENLSLVNVFTVKTNGNQLVKLKMLVLSGKGNENIKSVLNYFELKIATQIQADLVVLYNFFSRYGVLVEYGPRCISNILNVKNKLAIENVAFGPVHWGKGQSGDYNFQNSNILPLVNKKSTYYLFEGQKGIGIKESELCKLIKCTPQKLASWCTEPLPLAIRRRGALSLRPGP